jgi:hypothetical protein
VGTYLQNNESKKGGDMAQVVECLPSKHKALNSNRIITIIIIIIIIIK